MSDPVTYTAVLPVSEETVLFVSALLGAERRRRRTRSRRRALGCFRQAVLVLRWLLDGTRLAQLAADNRIGRSTAYRYLHEAIDALGGGADQRRGDDQPPLRGQHLGVGQGPGVGDRLHAQQRRDHLAGPAPAGGHLAAGRRRLGGVEVDDRDQLAQQMGVAQ